MSMSQDEHNFSTYSDWEWVMGGEILIFTLSSSRNKTWQLKFRNPLSDSPRYIRKSTRHREKSLATKRAIDVYNEYQSRRHLGLIKGKLTITELFDEYYSKMSLVMGSMAKQYHQTYWSRYFGADDITKLTTRDITEYFEWRIQEYIGRDSANAVQKAWRASDTSISFQNLKSERSAMAWLFRKAYGDNYIARLPNLPDDMDKWDGVHQLPQNNRRGRFTDEDYRKLQTYFRTIRRGLTNPKWKPVLENPDAPFHPESNRWITVAKRDGKEGRAARNKIFTSEKRRYPKAVFWFASLLMSNTGIRVSELAKLRHRDIKLVRDGDDFYTVVEIGMTVSKLRKYRLAISADGYLTWDRYQIYKQELEYKFNREIKDTHYVFPQPVGDNTYVGKREKFNNRYRYELKGLGLHHGLVETESGAKVRVYYSAYSFRSYYITQRLRNGLDVYTLSKNCGVSIKTLCSTYDVNETWEFRRQMVRHLNQKIDLNPSADDAERLGSQAVDFS